MSEACSVWGKVWKTISALISQQWPNMRSCFEPADRETHCWLSMIGTEWQRVAQSIRSEGGFWFFLRDLFWKSSFWGGGKIPTIGVGQMGRRLKLWSVFDKVQTLVRDTPLARWFRLFLKLRSLSVQVERGNFSRQIHEFLLAQLGIQTIKHSGWQGVGSLWASKNLP